MIKTYQHDNSYSLIHKAAISLPNKKNEKMSIIFLVMFLCVFFSVFAGSSESCECDNFVIYHSVGQNGYHYFTKQSVKIKGQSVYSSLSGDVIWWSDEEKSWNVHTKETEGLSAFRNIKKEDLICDLNKKYFTQLRPKDNNTRYISGRCLKYNDESCLVTKEERIVTGPLTFLAKAKRHCDFPFKYQNKTHFSCIRLESEETFSCPLYVNPTTRLIENGTLKKVVWGHCNQSCPVPPKTKDSWELWYIIIILVLGILFAIVIIYYFYTKRKKSFSRNKGEEENDTIQDGNGYGNIEKNLTEIEGRSFPSPIVIKWSDIKIKSIIGEGNFGRIYQGDIHLNEIQK